MVICNVEWCDSMMSSGQTPLTMMKKAILLSSSTYASVQVEPIPSFMALVCDDVLLQHNIRRACVDLADLTPHVDIDSQDMKGQTALHLAAYYDWSRNVPAIRRYGGWSWQRIVIGSFSCREFRKVLKLVILRIQGL